jgi:hypothetical protein
LVSDNFRHVLIRAFGLSSKCYAVIIVFPRKYIFKNAELISKLMLLDITTDKRETILSYLKAYWGLHGGEMPKDERKKLEDVIYKIEAAPIK